MDDQDLIYDIENFMSFRGLSHDDPISYLIEALSESEDVQKSDSKITIPKNPNQRPTKINVNRSNAEMRRKDKELISKIMRL